MFLRQQRRGETVGGDDIRVTRSLFCWNLLVLTLLFGGASLMNLGSAYDPLDPALATTRFVLVGGSLAMFLPFLPTAIAGFAVTTRGLALISLWVIFGGICLVSSVATQDHAGAIASNVWVLIGVPLVFFIGLPGVLKEEASKLVVLALLIGHTGYLIVSLFRYPDLHFEYKGIFGHPNEAGVTATVVAVCCLAWIVDRLQANSFGGLSAVALAALFGSSCFFVMLSGSRTSLLAIVAATALAAGLSVRHLRRKHLVSIAVASLILFSFGITLLPDAGIAEQVWQKHMNRVAKGDMLSRRDEIWTKVIDDMRPLGYGSEYFPESVGISAHNSLMHIIGERGPIAASIIACIAIWAMVTAVQQAVRDRGRRSFSAAPALIAVCFWALSMGEAMFGSLGTGITLAYLLSIGTAFAGGGRVSARTSDSRDRPWLGRPIEGC